MVRKWLLAGLVVLTFIIGPVVQAEAASSDSGTVADTYKSKTHDVKVSKNTKKEQQIAPAAGDSNLFVIFLKLIGALALVLALIYFLYRFVAKRTKHFQEDGSIKNLGGVSVGANRSVQLVRVGKEVLVVGVGESVQLLKEIQDPEALEALLKQEERPDPLQENVKKALRWTVKKTMNNNEKEAPAPFKSLLSGKLAQLKKERTEKIEKAVRGGGDHE